jgi:diacylglycerol kinase
MNPYRKRLRSFRFAWQGIIFLFQDFNIRLHSYCAVLVLVLAAVIGVSLEEWLFLASAIAAVMVSEGFNSALEKVVDLVSPQPHPLAGQAKDMAAGAVLLASAYALVVGLAVFLPKLIRLFWL